MIKRTLEILSVVALVLIILPYGKDYAPSIFGGPLIQMGSLILAGFLIGFGGVLALHQWFARKNRIYFIGFLFMAILQFGSIYGWYLLGHSASKVLEELSDHSMMYVLAERAQVASQAEKRFDAAAQYYHAYGVKLGYVDANGALVRFSPDEAHHRERQEWIAIIKDQESTRSILGTALRQTRTNLGLLPGMMSLGILAGAIGLAYFPPKRQAQQISDGNAQKPLGVEREA